MAKIVRKLNSNDFCFCSDIAKFLSAAKWPKIKWTRTENTFFSIIWKLETYFDVKLIDSEFGYFCIHAAHWRNGSNCEICLVLAYENNTICAASERGIGIEPNRQCFSIKFRYAVAA